MKMIICKSCGLEKEYEAKDLCHVCYNREWKHRVREADREKYLMQKNSWRNGSEDTVKKVFAKFKSKCTECGSTDRLCIHHLDHKGRNYLRKGLKANNQIDNLVLLCVHCHMTLHSNAYWRQRKLEVVGK